MLRVFFDQWCWSHLDQVAHGTRKDPGLPEPLDLLRFGTQSGLVSLPVGSEHYMDSYRYENVEVRRRRGKLMSELYRGHTMCPITTPLRAKIDLALRDTFGRPTETRRSDATWRQAARWTWPTIGFVSYDRGDASLYVLPDEYATAGADTRNTS